MFYDMLQDEIDAHITSDYVTSIAEISSSGDDPEEMLMVSHASKSFRIITARNKVTLRDNKIVATIHTNIDGMIQVMTDRSMITIPLEDPKMVNIVVQEAIDAMWNHSRDRSNKILIDQFTTIVAGIGVITMFVFLIFLLNIEWQVLAN